MDDLLEKENWVAEGQEWQKGFPLCVPFCEPCYRIIHLKKKKNLVPALLLCPDLLIPLSVTSLKTTQLNALRHHAPGTGSIFGVKFVYSFSFLA